MSRRMYKGVYKCECCGKVGTFGKGKISSSMNLTDGEIIGVLRNSEGVESCVIHRCSDTTSGIAKLVGLKKEFPGFDEIGK